MIIHINKDDTLYAIILKSRFEKNGISFLTPNHHYMQIAHIKHPLNTVIGAHFHNVIPRVVNQTQEVLVIKTGKLRVDFYDDQNRYLESHILESGDSVALLSGGHGFKTLEDVEIIEVKQGPYLQEQDKTRFMGVGDQEVKVCSYDNMQRNYETV